MCMSGHGTFPDMGQRVRKSERVTDTLPGRSIAASPFSLDCLADVPLRVRQYIN